MNQTSFSLGLVLAFAIALPSSAAHAQLLRTFVSATGNDANTCGRNAPCRSLQIAHDKTIGGGEINMLDPAGYGAVTITKAISIVNDGVGSAGILVPTGGTGITVNAAATDIINLRGLIIEGALVGHDGIQFNTGKSLMIENCVIRNLNGTGTFYRPNGAGVALNLHVSNTLVSNILNDAILVQPTGNVGIGAVFNRVELYDNGGSGLFVNTTFATGQIFATATDSVASRNNTGFRTDSTNGFVMLMVVRSVSANNGTGYGAVGGQLVLAQSTVMGNGLAYTSPPDSIFSFGDNYVRGNVNGEAAIQLISTK
ncbi:MAG: hypothetical protein ABI624_10900 [Casimicrobiaceae bacterium]